LSSSETTFNAAADVLSRSKAIETRSSSDGSDGAGDGDAGGDVVAEEAGEVDGETDRETDGDDRTRAMLPHSLDPYRARLCGTTVPS
jgi:hypothetical protein